MTSKSSASANRSGTSPTTGLTRDVGWEIGVSRTVDQPIDQVWSYLTSPDGIRRWLGGGLVLPSDKGAEYRTPDGTTGDLRSFHPGDRIRLTWRPADWDHSTTLQIVVRANGDRTSLRFHQERLADSGEREQQRRHWATVANGIVEDLARSD